MNEVKALLAEKIGNSYVRRRLGPDWYELARVIVDQVWDELGIQEAAARRMFDTRMMELDRSGFQPHVEQALRDNLAHFIAQNSATSVTFVEPKRGSDDYHARMGEARISTLIITHVPLRD